MGLFKKLLVIILFFLAPVTIYAQTSSDWYMAGANPQRTSWVSEQVLSSLNTRVEWALPVEAYIDQKVQLIGANGMIYVSTSKGLLALDAATGQLNWRYDTELPLGHSPTVDLSRNPPVLYVGGFDKRLHVLNADTGQRLWTFNGAKAGYNTNPLVVENKVILGNRDGSVYAIGAHGSTQQGQQLWKFQTDGPVMFSPAYKNGVIYFASNDSHAYAVQASNGSQIWKSQPLPGDGFHTYFPVIYRDKVIFPAVHQQGDHIVDEYPGGTEGTMIGTVENPTTWSAGWHVLDPWRIRQHYQTSPENRTYIILNQSNGQEFTFNAGNGTEYVPFTYWNDEGNQYPPIVDPQDRWAYSTGPISCCSDAKGKLYAWDLDHPSKLIIVGASASTSNNTISATGGWAAMAEPQAFSGGGNAIYRNLCCDRVGGWFGIGSLSGSGNFWSYNLNNQIPNYDVYWTLSPVEIARHQGWYSGEYTTGTGTYHNHGDQAPLIPYNGRVYAHRSNTIFAFGTGPQRGLLPPISQPSDVINSIPVPSETELKARLEAEIQKIVEVNGHLRPGYLPANLHNYGDNRFHLEDYFTNPGDTLFTLSYAYPHLSPSLKQQVSDYLSQELIPDYFDTNPGSSNPTMYTNIGYTEGIQRESIVLPSDYLASFRPQTKTTSSGAWSWTYPPHNFYALYQYAKNVPGVNISRMYTLAKTKLRVPANVTNETTVFTNDPFQHNAWITGYHGYLKLQELAGQQSDSQGRRSEVIAERDRLIALRASLFNKETAWVDLQADTANNSKKSLDIARNFMFLSPELGGDYRNNATLMTKAQDAMNMYEDIAPFWFAGLYEAMNGESVFQNLYVQPALFQAKAWIFQERREQLYKYLDAPLFERGDLFYIQNLVATIEAPSDPSYTPPPSTPTSQPSATPVPQPGDTDADGDVDIFDYNTVISRFGQTVSGGAHNGDLDGDSDVDIFDYNEVISNFGT